MRSRLAITKSCSEGTIVSKLLRSKDNGGTSSRARALSIDARMSAMHAIELSSAT